MDELFHEIVDYQKQVTQDGGFWNIEDKLQKEEENIRLELADWMELFDEHGEKFFYNRKSDASRFDDPRMQVYHKLYARIKMVTKMRERLPLLARAPRPEAPTELERELERRQNEEEEKYLNRLVKIQSMARVVLSKKKVKQVKAQATVQKGPQPLRGRLRLRMEKIGPDGSKELVLAQTTPHRRAKAAKKIQARMRGVLARKRFKPLVQHRQFLSKIVTKIQRRARLFLFKRALTKLKAQRRIDKAIEIQRVYRGYVDRKYHTKFKSEKVRFDWMMKCIVTLQGGFRMSLAMRERKRLKT